MSLAFYFSLFSAGKPEEFSVSLQLATVLFGISLATNAPLAFFILVSNKDSDFLDMLNRSKYFGWIQPIYDSEKVRYRYEENEIIGYNIVGPDDKVLSTNPSVFPSYDKALSYLIEIIENELNKLKTIREKTIISKALIIKNKKMMTI